MKKRLTPIFPSQETLTGFKWMGNRSEEIESSDPSCRVLMAFEEAIGFMCGTNVLDKDGVSAAAKIAEMVNHLEGKGESLSSQLNGLYRK